MRGKPIAWAIMTVLATGVAAYALAVLLVPGFGPPLVTALRTKIPWGPGHFIGGAVALAVGPWQFNRRLRARALTVHRWMGRAYVIAVLGGGVSALVLAATSQEGMVTHIGFGALAVLWLVCTIRAYVAIRRGDDVTHRAWMTRSFALTLAAVTLRIILPFELAALRMPFHDAYRIVSWLCWVPNLAVAEWIVRRRILVPTEVRI